MDVKEKLVELLTGYSIDTETDAEYVVDHLIAHGVTAQEWISVKDRLPESEDFVLTIVSGQHRNITLDKAYELAEYCPEGWILETWPEWESPDVTHWMPLPQLPKGDSNG